MEGSLPENTAERQSRFRGRNPLAQEFGKQLYVRGTPTKMAAVFALLSISIRQEWISVLA